MMVEEYYLYDHTHPLDWRVDDKEEIQTLVLCCNKLYNVKSTKFIDVSRETWNKKIYLIFELTDSGYSKLFNAFSKFLIEETRKYDSETGPGQAIMLYNKGIRLFSESKTLAEKEIKGLIGELEFLRTKMIPKYGEIKSIHSWMNKYFGKQDFIIDDMWFEIKTTAIDSHKVKISSLDQLDKESEGNLVIVKLQRTSIESGSRITLNSIHGKLCNEIEDAAVRDEFKESMKAIGYMNDTKYEEFAYEISSIKQYSVKDKFPRLRRSTLNIPGISDAEYEIDIDLIKQFEV